MLKSEMSWSQIFSSRISFRWVLLISLFLIFSSGFDKLTHSPCYEHDNHIFCYDGVVRNSAYYRTFESLNRIELFHVATNKERNDEDLSKSKTSCEIALSRDYQLVLPDNSSMPIIMFQPRYCIGFGNQLGFAFELISFAISKGIAFARVEAHDDFPIHQCSDARDARSMLKYLPKLVIPARPLAKLTKPLCDSIPEWPWESSSSYFFSQIPLLSLINHHMVSSYIQRYFVHNRRDLTPKLFLHSLTLHFRCSDNLAHSSMGLLPFSDYNKTLQAISHQPIMSSNQSHGGGIRSVVIYTDTHLYRSHGAICTRALAEIEALISSQPNLQGLDLIVHRTTTLKTYAMMHISRILLCSASTLCFFAALGNDHAFVPVGKGVVIELPRYAFKSNITFFQTRMIRPKQETMHPDDFAKDFLST